PTPGSRALLNGPPLALGRGGNILIRRAALSPVSCFDLPQLCGQFVDLCLALCCFGREPLAEGLDFRVARAALAGDEPIFKAGADGRTEGMDKQAGSQVVDGETGPGQGHSLAGDGRGEHHGRVAETWSAGGIDAGQADKVYPRLPVELYPLRNVIMQQHVVAQIFRSPERLFSGGKGRAADWEAAITHKPMADQSRIEAEIGRASCRERVQNTEI